MDTFAAQTLMTDKQFAMHQAIIERALERNQRWKIHEMTDWFDIRRLKYRTTLGMFAWSCDKIRVKWLSKPHVNHMGEAILTDSDLARDYIALKYLDRVPKCTTDQWLKCVKDRRSPPIYCQPCRLDEAVYIDIAGAYWQIVRAVGWNVNYNPSKFLDVLSRMTDFPYPTKKLTRNCLVSIGIPSPMRQWDGEKIVYVSRPTKFVNLILYRLVMDVLNSIAGDMIDVGAVYVYTDGYIFDRKHAERGFDVLAQWGLSSTVKRYGALDLVSPNCYCFTNERDGMLATENYKQRPNRARRQISKVYTTESAWLRQRFSRFAEYAIGEWEWIRQ